MSPRQNMTSAMGNVTSACCVNNIQEMHQFQKQLALTDTRMLLKKSACFAALACARGSNQRWGKWTNKQGDVSAESEDRYKEVESVTDKRKCCQLFLSACCYHGDNACIESGVNHISPARSVSQNCIKKYDSNCCKKQNALFLLGLVSNKKDISASVFALGGLSLCQHSVICHQHCYATNTELTAV
jgi:hypothetical protein